VKRALLVVAAALLLVGCAGDDNASEETTDTVTLPALGNARVYWLLDGKVWPALREVQASGDAATDVMSDLIAGPSPQEQEELGFRTAIPAGATPEVTVHSGVATVEFDGATELSPEALAQIVYTETALPGVNSVMINAQGVTAASYTRADFEEQTPSVLVESPLAFEQVTSPLRAEGTANTFEANFHYELTDTDGLIVDQNFVTATSGTGTRGTFEFTTKPYTVPFDGIGSLIVFERSAEDGSRMNIVEIPLRMSR
jgi:germination protein M